MAVLSSTTPCRTNSPSRYYPSLQAARLLCAALMLACAVVATPSRAGDDAAASGHRSAAARGMRGALAARPRSGVGTFDVQTIPIFVTPSPSAVSSGSPLSCTITFSAPAASSGYVQVNCTQQSLLTSPSGSWPYRASFPAGATSVTITIGTAVVHSTTAATIGSCQAGMDATNPANWQATHGVSLLATGG